MIHSLRKLFGRGRNPLAQTLDFRTSVEMIVQKQLAGESEAVRGRVKVEYHKDPESFTTRQELVTIRLDRDDELNERSIAIRNIPGSNEYELRSREGTGKILDLWEAWSGKSSCTAQKNQKSLGRALKSPLKEMKGLARKFLKRQMEAQQFPAF